MPINNTNNGRLQRYRRRVQMRRRRRLLGRFLGLLWVACGVIATYKLLMVISNTPTPIVVALSGGIKNLPDRGDLLIISNRTEEVRVGDDVLFKIQDRDIPIFHRVLKLYEDARTGQLDIRTKGDDNGADDLGLYAPAQKWIHREDIWGHVIARVPALGHLRIYMWGWLLFQELMFGVAIYSIVFGLQPILGKPSQSFIMFYLLVFSTLLTGSST